MTLIESGGGMGPEKPRRPARRKPRGRCQLPRRTLRQMRCKSRRSLSPPRECVTKKERGHYLESEFERAARDAHPDRGRRRGHAARGARRRPPLRPREPAVTAGLGADEAALRFEEDNDDYNAIMVKTLAGRLAEAFAELMHRRVRTESWGYAADENLDNDALIREEHTEKRTFWRLLDVKNNAGITLTENCAMSPGAAISGYYFSHPNSAYFGVAEIGRDQVEDYAERKGWTLEEAEKWLSPNLG